MRYRCGYKEDDGKTSFVTSWSTSSSFDGLSFPSGKSFLRQNPMNRYYICETGSVKELALRDDSILFLSHRYGRRDLFLVSYTENKDKKGACTKRRQYLISFPTGMVEEICFLFLILKKKTKNTRVSCLPIVICYTRCLNYGFFWKWVEKRQVVPNLAFVLHY